MYCRNYTGTISCVSFVERFNIRLCPCLRESTLGGYCVHS